ncbi:hypothetical protein AFERRI_530177 [Acidithiobacillus ferrivorans]|uniref:Uncharacterized protein n=1 Tax=Acidithiobacillus ferrivorans TaxID=160808 RepID=A0A060URM5_9PROT|nr:hypothetical protein AFERRI_530177 [Acidithiobacillus ferrivorans]
MDRIFLTTDGVSKAAALGKVDVQIQAFYLHRRSHVLYQPTVESLLTRQRIRSSGAII